MTTNGMDQLQTVGGVSDDGYVTRKGQTGEGEAACVRCLETKIINQKKKVYSSN